MIRPTKRQDIDKLCCSINLVRQMTGQVGLVRIYEGPDNTIFIRNNGRRYVASKDTGEIIAVYKSKGWK